MSAARPLRKPVFIKVEKFEPDIQGINVVVKVESVQLVKERELIDGRMLRIAEALVGDSTGSIIMTLRDDQIDVAKPNTTIVVRNGRIEMFKNHMRLGVTHWGLVEPSTESLIEEINRSINLSDTEFELVDA